MQWLADLLIGALRWCLDLVGAVLEVLLLVFTDVACFLLEGLGKAVIALVGAFDFSAITNYIAPAVDNIPLGLLNMMVLLGINPAMAIIGSALVVRLILQLIPFTRLGS